MERECDGGLHVLACDYERLCPSAVLAFPVPGVRVERVEGRPLVTTPA